MLLKIDVLSLCSNKGLSMQQGRKAIVIGASSGIGLEVAKLLIEQGWMVGVAARRVELLKERKKFVLKI